MTIHVRNKSVAYMRAVVLLIAAMAANPTR
jgi:hypothetical protein